MSDGELWAYAAMAILAAGIGVGLAINAQLKATQRELEAQFAEDRRRQAGGEGGQ